MRGMRNAHRIVYTAYSEDVDLRRHIHRQNKNVKMAQELVLEVDDLIRLIQQRNQ
jgi:hypothetical protein